jgi:hypothetical protein
MASKSACADSKRQAIEASIEEAEAIVSVQV